MKTFIFLLMPALLLAQYWGERPNEKSFENSSVYFNSYYLNPFALYQFNRVSTGLIEDPYLQSYLNPASIPQDSTTANQFYIDFRGDRSEPALSRYVPLNPYADYNRIYYRPDPRWYTVSRAEPEPLFSIGISRLITQNLYINLGYQFVFKEETYYQMPTWIYNARYGKDAMGAALTDESATPVINRSAGEDGMHTRGHFFAANLAYQLNEMWAVGLHFNGVSHSRSGEYGRLRRDEYSSTEDGNWFSLYSKQRDNTYYHWAGGLGVQARISPKLTLGLKLTRLKGTADQTYTKNDSSFYAHTWYSANRSSSHYSSRSSHTSQNWRHKGATNSGLFLLNYRWSENRSMQFYYLYEYNQTDLNNRSVIRDTSFYSGSYQYGTDYSTYRSWSKLNDQRHAVGDFSKKSHQAMLSFRWFETKRTQVHLGFLVSDIFYQTKTTEPVLALGQSDYYHTYTDDNGEPLSSHYFHYRYEDKTLVWNTKTEKQNIQIPIMLRFLINDTWSLMLAVNRIWNYWRVEEVTTAYFKVRDKNDNSETKHETDFGERYTEPVRTISEDTIAFLSGLTIQISPRFQINIMANPQFVPNWQVMQWWLGFKIGM